MSIEERERVLLLLLLLLLLLFFFFFIIITIIIIITITSLTQTYRSIILEPARINPFKDLFFFKELGI